MSQMYKIYGNAQKIHERELELLSKEVRDTKAGAIPLPQSLVLTWSQQGDPILAGVKLAVDQGLTDELVTYLAIKEFDGVVKRYHDELVSITGAQIGATNALHSSFIALTKSFKGAIENRVEPDKIKRDLFAMTDKVNSIEKSLQQLRAKVDQEIADTVKTVNTILDSIRTDTEIMHSHSDNKNGEVYAEAEKKLWRHTVELARYFAINRAKGGDGRESVNIITDHEIYELIGSTHAANLSYENQKKSVLEGDEVFNPINLVQSSLSSKRSGVVGEVELVSGGKGADDIRSRIKGGVIGGLLEMRDVALVKALEMHTEFKGAIVKELNSFHSGLSPKHGHEVLTGEKEFNDDSLLGAKGTVVIAALDNQGESVTIPALQLNLEDLGYVSGTGSFVTPKACVNAINSYFSPENRRLEVGALHDLKLINKHRGDGKLEFVFQASNTRSDQVIDIEISDISQGASLIGGASSNSSSKLSVSAGAVQRVLHGSSIVLNQSAGSLVLGFKVRVEGGQEVFVHYEVSESETGKSFSVSKVSTDGTKYSKESQYIKSEYVSTGNIARLKPRGTAGGSVLELQASPSSKFAIASSDARLSGFPLNGPRVENLQFAEFFGMNDLLQNTQKGLKVKSGAGSFPAYVPLMQNSNISGDTQQLVHHYSISKASSAVQVNFEGLRESLVTHLASFYVSVRDAKERSTKMAESSSSVVKGLEDALSDNQRDMNASLLMITKKQSDMASALRANRELHESFLRAIS